jgi:Nuclear RNA-splicing-associated protein
MENHGSHDCWHSLVKGSGEILEQIVTRDQHHTINQIATRGDGNTFQEKMAGLLKKQL